MKQVDANKDKSDLRPEKALTEANLEQQAKRQHSYLALVEACKEKKLKRVECILSERPELVNHKDKHNRTLLHYSAILVQEPQKQQQQQQPQEHQEQDASVACFDYLSGRCELKLWWQQDADGLSVLHLAVISANLPLVRHLVFEHPNSAKYPLVFSLDNESHSPLHWAVITNNLDCVRLLVEFGGTKLAHEPDLNGATPLHYSTQTRDYPKYRQQLKCMLRQAGSARSKPREPSFQESLSFDEELEARETEAPPKLQQEEEALGFNRRGLEILEFLVQLPEINLECVDKDLRTPLLWAASSGNRDALLLLLASGANADTSDINRLGALHCAASHGFTDCLECLLNQAAARQRLESVVNQADNLNCTPLFYSVLSGNIDCIETLLERGAQRDWQDSKGRTAAHFAALKGQLNSLKLLEARGANLWLANKQGDLPLHYAIKSGRQQVTKWLLEHSPYENTVNAINNFGRAPIHLAIVKNQPAMVEYLLSRGANLNQLVKVRDKQPGGSKRTHQQQQQPAAGVSALVNNSTAHQAKNGLQYHYETALDMARNLNKAECVRLLRGHAALSAEQVIRARGEQQFEAQAAQPPATSSNQQRSLFDLQSADGISPIGFETSCSSATPTSNSTRAPANSGGASKRQSTGTTSNTLGSTNFTPTGSSMAESSSSPATATRVGDEQQLPALPKRPAPDSLPQTDSTGSSALSQNSLASLRGPNAPQVELLEEENQNYGGLAQQQGSSMQQAASSSTRPQRLGQAKQAASFRSIRAEASEEDDEEEEEEARQPYEGGIGYNNQHVNASIKYKLYGDLRRPPFEQIQGANRSFPPFQQPQATPRGAKRSGRGSLSAPTKNDARLEESFSRAGGQEIITNVNVYTSPCAHCLHLQAEHCSQCGHKAKLSLERAKPETRAGCSMSCSDDEDSATEEEADASLASANNSEQAAPPAGAAALPRSFNPSSSVRHQRPPLYQHLPPSQNHNQQLPVILSDQEQSHSAASERNETGEPLALDDDSPVCPADEQPSGAPAQQQVCEEGPSGCRAKSPADQEPRFDRSERLRCRQTGNRHQRVKSPVAEYIHGSPTKSSPARGAAECKARASRHDYSQVRAKVDSRRADNDEWAWLGSTSHANRPLAEQQPSRSVSRQTVLKESGTMTRRMSSEEEEAGGSMLTTRLEQSIRKYRQENKLFEELQKLKRSQIRSGRANEALLVKRLAEHFRHQAAYVDLIGLDTYRGPYTYKAYERFLYDQLRKLSQSNCQKLADRLSDSLVGASLVGGNQQQQQQQTASGRTQQAADFYSTANFMDDDLRADLELRRVIGGTEAENDSDFYESYAGHQSAGGGQKQLSGVHAVSEGQTMNDALEEQSGNQTHEQAKDATKSGEQQANAGRQSGSSRSSSRRSSVEVEREKMQQLALVTKQQSVSKEESQEKEQFESELDNLSAAIITDALGNVSRANSPEPAHVAASAEQPNEAGESVEAAETSIKSEKSAEEEEEEDSLAPLTRLHTRRRSVVNIGNKMEVVYHDVGIEIDSVGDEKNYQAQAERGKESEAELSETERGHQASEAALSSPQSGEGEQQLSDAAPRTVEQSEQLSDVEEEQLEEEPAQLETKEAAQAEGSLVDGANLPVEEEQGEVQQAASQSARSSLSNATQYRRRSSSPSVISVIEDKSTTTRESLGSASKRRASIASELSALDSTAPAKELKKVFNGHDLDRLHAKRVSERDREPKNDSAKVEVEPSEPEAPCVEDSEQKLEANVKSPTRRSPGPRLMRSRLPRGKYKVKVPLEDVRERWRQIKAAERLKLEGDGESEQVPVRYALSALSSGTEGKEADSATQEPTNGVGGGKKLAKSQPNLRQVEESEVRAEDEEEASQRESQAKQNYTLLYEVNKKMATGHGEKQGEKGGTKTNASKRMMTKVNWCHKKVVRIVDVRTLKRTLSLPDSLLYSNNLLKRFNILKL